MDSISCELEFSCCNLRSAVANEKVIWEILLRIAADFSVMVAGWQFYVETEFPVVEFARHAARWLDKGGVTDFVYVSMESDQDPLIGFYVEPEDQFRIYSPYQMFDAPSLIVGERLRSALAFFIAKLRQNAVLELDINIGIAL